MPRLKMVWLPLRKWISFIPIAFIVYILLQYLVYQPEIRITSLERSAYIGEAKLLNLTNSLQNVEDQQAISNISANRSHSRYLQSGSLDSLGQREIFRHLQDVANSQTIAESKGLEGKPEYVPPGDIYAHVNSHENYPKIDVISDPVYTQENQVKIDAVEQPNVIYNQGPIDVVPSSLDPVEVKSEVGSDKYIKDPSTLPDSVVRAEPEQSPTGNEIPNSKATVQNSPNPERPMDTQVNVGSADVGDSFYTKDVLSPKMDQSSGHAEDKDTSNVAKEDSVSISISTVERSARASVSSTKSKPETKVQIANQEPNPSQSNANDLPGANVIIDKPHSSDKDSGSKPESEVIPSPKFKTTKTDVKEVKKENQPVKKSVIKSEKQKKVITKNMIKQAIAKNRKQPKLQFSIGYLHGKIKVGDVYDKGYMIPQEELCPNNGRDLRVMIFVTTAPDHEHHRNAIRQTWGHFAMRKDVSIGFLVGRPDKVEAQNVIDRENDRYGDIIQSNFIDVYANLTLKSVSMFEWLNTYCSEVQFVLKTDDDMYINVPLLLAFIYTKRNDKRAIYGRLARNWKPVRNKKSKYYISKETYSTLKYPEFLTGPAYLFTIDISEDLYARAMDSILFKLEDVFITGLVAESLKIKRVGDSHFRNEKINLKDTCKLMQTISIHMVKYEEEFDIYKRTLDGKTKCRIK